MEDNLNENIEKNNGFSITGLVLGIVAIVIALIPIVNIISFILLCIGIIFSIIGICNKGKKQCQ